MSRATNGVLLFAVIVSLVIPIAGLAQTHAIRDVRIVTGTGEIIAEGNIVMQDGRIAAMGPNVNIPEDAETVDGRGLTAYPGMIDPHTTVGMQEINSIRATIDTVELGDLNPHMKASGAINPLSEHVAVTRVNGITTVMAAPAGGLFSGQGAVINLDGWVLGDMLVEDTAAMFVNFPAELTFSAETPADRQREREEEREESIDLLRSTLVEAQAFAKLVDGGVADPENFVLASLVPVVRGEMPVIFNVNTDAEVREALEIAEEFGLQTVLSGCSYAQGVVDLIAESGASVILGSVKDLPEYDEDPYDAVFSMATRLHEAGVKFAFSTRSSAHVRDLPFQAGMAVAFGLPEEEALKAVTINAAEILGIDDRVGSLAEGKVANIVLMDGNPLEVITRVEHLFIAGAPVGLDSKHTELYEIFRNRPQNAGR